MQAIRRILVAVKDPAARSFPTVGKAAQLARALGARIELFHAIDAPVYIDLGRLSKGSLQQIEDDGRKESLRRLDRLAARIGGRGLKVSTAVEWDYPVYESIVRRANRIGADLIVAERHGGRYVAPWLLRITDWELLRLSPVPVLIVKSRRPYRHPIVLAAVDPRHAFSKPPRLDEDIVRLGTAVTRALRGTLHAVHAYVPALIGVPPETWSAADITAEIEARAAAHAKTDLERVLKSASVPRARRHLVAGHPIDTILGVARSTRCAIVVMGAISRSGLKSVFIGNTAERVLDDLPCDLLVLKPRSFVSRVPHAVRGLRLATAAPMPW